MCALSTIEQIGSSTMPATSIESLSKVSTNSTMWTWSPKPTCGTKFRTHSERLMCGATTRCWLDSMALVSVTLWIEVASLSVHKAQSRVRHRRLRSNLCVCLKATNRWLRPVTRISSLRSLASPLLSETSPCVLLKVSPSEVAPVILLVKRTRYSWAIW